MSYESIFSLYQSSSREIDRIFQYMVKFEASDLHIKAGTSPSLRISGAIRSLDMSALTANQCERLIFDIMADDLIEEYKKNRDVEFTYMLPEGHRFRINVFKERGTIALSARVVPLAIPSFEELVLPRQTFERIIQADSGLVIVSGITGCGKSTTIASMIEYINQNRRCHIITIEDPIEFLYQDKKSFINQREIGSDVASFSGALKNLVRQDPDVIVVGEMRDYETFNFGLTAAETGHLVFGTMHAATASHIISRVLDLTPSERHQQVRQSLAFNLRAVVCQKLLPSIKLGHTMVPALEIMLTNSTIKSLILEGHDSKIIEAIKACGLEGMIDFSNSLADLINKGYITEKTGMEHAPNREALQMILQGINLTGDRGILTTS